MDWMQLGWLATWAYCDTTDTSYRKNLPQAWCEDTFLKNLIKNGVHVTSSVPTLLCYVLSQWTYQVIPTWLSIHFIFRCIWAAMSSVLHYLHQSLS